MIKQLLFFIVLTVSPFLSLAASECMVLEKNLVEYPQDVYSWYEAIRTFPPDIQRLFMQYQASTVLEPSASITNVSVKNPNEYGTFSPVPLALSNTSTYLAYNSTGVHILNLDTLELHKVLRTPSRITAAAFSPDDTKLVLVDLGYNLYVIENNNFKPEGDLIKAAHMKTTLGRPLFEKKKGGCMQRCIYVGFTSETDIIVVDNHRNIYSHNLDTQSTIPLNFMQCTQPVGSTKPCDDKIYFCGTTDALDLIMVSASNLTGSFRMKVEQFNAKTCEWSAPFGNLSFSGRGDKIDLRGKWLLMREHLFNLQTKQYRALYDHWVDVTFSPDTRFIFSQAKDGSLLIKHRLTGALIASGRPPYHPARRGQYFFYGTHSIGVIRRPEDYRGQLDLYTVKLLWTYLAQFQEGLCSLDTLVFVKFLDDLFQEGLVLKQNGLVINTSPLVRIVAEASYPPKECINIANRPYTLRYTLLLRKPQAYALLKKARLKIIKVDVQKVEGTEPNSSPRQLTQTSMERLKAIWESFSEQERAAFSQEYDVAL